VELEPQSRSRRWNWSRNQGAVGGIGAAIKEPSVELEPQSRSRSHGAAIKEAIREVIREAIREEIRDHHLT